jgi:serine/threonine-protein kinase
VLGDRYRLTGKLGQGGMGAVYKAEDLRLKRTVAVKLLFAGPLDDERTAERFIREAECLARLSHPNLLHVYDFGAEDDLRYFAMELLSGVTLSALIRTRGKLNPNELLPLLGQLLAALDYIHRQGITHRDLKGGNIMVAGRRVVLMDFGLAKSEGAGGLTTAGALLGTPEFMAPEQAEGTVVGPATDLYSLGAVMYEALSGSVPFTGRSALAIIRQHARTPPPPLAERVPGLDPRLAACVHRCLAKAPAERYQAVSELAADLAAVMGTPELTQLAAGQARQEMLTGQAAWVRPEPAKNAAARSRVRWAVAAALLLAALAAALLFFRRGRDGRSRIEPPATTVPKPDSQPSAKPVEQPLPMVGLAGAEGKEYRLLRFSGAGMDRKHWKLEVESRSAPGKPWQRETLTYQQYCDLLMKKEAVKP